MKLERFKTRQSTHFLLEKWLVSWQLYGHTGHSAVGKMCKLDGGLPGKYRKCQRAHGLMPLIAFFTSVSKEEFCKECLQIPLLRYFKNFIQKHFYYSYLYNSFQYK